MNKLAWPEFTFSPINLWVMPKLTVVDLEIVYKQGVKTYKTTIKDNPFYNMRKENV